MAHRLQERSRQIAYAAASDEPPMARKYMPARLRNSTPLTVSPSIVYVAALNGASSTSNTNSPPKKGATYMPIVKQDGPIDLGAFEGCLSGQA